MKARIACLLLAGLFAVGTTTYAHHSFAATYIEKEQIKIEGKIAQFVFRNPHSFVHVLVKDENGAMIRWAVEWQGGGQLGASGITAQTFKAGDPVIITGNPGRDASEHRMRMVTLKRTTDGFGWGNRPGEVVN